MNDTARLRKVKEILNKKRPNFLRQDAHKKKRLAQVWRNPQGIQGKVKKAIKGHRPMVKVGWGSPKILRGELRSGERPVLVQSITQIEALPQKSAIIIGRTVGLRKRILIFEKAKKEGHKILGLPENYAEISKNKIATSKEKTKPKALEQKVESAKIEMSKQKTRVQTPNEGEKK
ncbi:50S ribosomal protein L32e [Candidatus Woesearchaeota archaeon]|nr:50S ribosomal protein L32e [Candidatus Woesearchaeota archaeon]